MHRARWLPVVDDESAGVPPIVMTRMERIKTSADIMPESASVCEQVADDYSSKVL